MSRINLVVHHDPRKRIFPRMYVYFRDLICAPECGVQPVRLRLIFLVWVKASTCDKRTPALLSVSARGARPTINIYKSSVGFNVTHSLYVCTIIFNRMRVCMCCRRTTASTTSTRSRTCRSAVSTRVTNASLASSPNTPSGSGSRATFSGATSRCDPWRRPSGTDAQIIQLWYEITKKNQKFSK